MDDETMTGAGAVDGMEAAAGTPADGAAALSEAVAARAGSDPDTAGTETGADGEAEAGEVRTAAEIEPELEALLLMAEEALPTAVLAGAVGTPVAIVETALADLAAFYDETGRGFELRDVGGGWRYSTRPRHHELLCRWMIEGQVNRLTQAGLETLAVIAYLQPVSRSRVSAVRGVNVDSAVRTLLARDLIAEAGQDEVTGAGLLRTTDYFLERIGLASVDDLPPIAPRLPDAAQLEAELASLAEARLATSESPSGGGATTDDDRVATPAAATSTGEPGADNE